MNGNQYLELEPEQWSQILDITQEYSYFLQNTGLLSVFENSIHLTETVFEKARKYSNIKEKDVKEEEYKFSNPKNNYTNSMKRFFQVGKIEVFCLVERKE